MLKSVIVHSSFEDSEQVKKDLLQTIDLLHQSDKISPVEIIGEIPVLNYDNISGIIIITASGGTEQLINSLVVESGKPALIIAVSRKNSIAASLESYSYLKDKHPVKLYISENPEEDRTQIECFAKVCSAVERINNSRFGLIGEPSDWLLSSTGIDSFGKFSTELIKLPTSEIVERVDKIDEQNSTELLKAIKSVYPNSSVADSSVRESAKVYSAMKQMIEENKLDAVSIRCFDLLEYKYTACMGMSMCNDEGIVSGCEGDIPAAFTMMIGTYITGEPCWMANPAVINKDENTVTFAHCTVPSRMIENLSGANLTTHMESGLSTANQGRLHNTDVTIIRINSDFNKLSVATGKIIESDMREPSLCRTQAVVKLHGSIGSWIESAPGNHHIVVYGNVVSMLQDFCNFTGVNIILNQ